MNISKNKVFPAIENAVRSSFENLLFIDFDKAIEVKNPRFQMTDQVTHIEMREPFGGAIYIVIGYDLAFEILQSISEEKNENVLKLLVDETMAEICNIVTGRFMAEIVPADLEFNFSLPCCTKIGKQSNIQETNNNFYAMEFRHRDKSIYCMFKN